MKKSVKKAWVTALRSGHYEQGYGQLRDNHNDFCCFGVLCNLHAMAHPKIAKKQKDPTMYMREYELLPKTVVKWAGLSNTTRVTIQNMFAPLEKHNDHGRTFAEIADAVEEQL